jgi:carboxypeptidase D
MPSLSSLVGVSAGLASLAAGQYFPPSPEDVRVIHSKHQEGVTISYKEVCL